MHHLTQMRNGEGVDVVTGVVLDVVATGVRPPRSVVYGRVTGSIP
jgi:hypothetical protein